VLHLKAERYDVQRRLDADAAVRASDPVTAAVFDRVGPRPRDPSAASLWDEAVGRLAQHQAAWDLADAIGRRPQLLGDNAYALSHRAAVANVERLDRALGRELQIEPPSRSSSRSL
jgi:cyanophycinase-like exopeptidase